MSLPVLGIDIGGTSIKARLADGDDLTLGTWREPTPAQDPSGASTAEVIGAMVERARRTAPLGAVGVVVPGIVDDDAGVCIHSVNLGWHDLPIRDILQRRVDLPMAFGHDVRAGALAESLTGAAAGVVGPVVFIPIGTGVASALIIDGAVISSGGWAGEIGQVILDSGPHAGHRVEEIASATGIARRAGQPNALAVAELVTAGDAVATAAWDEGIDVLADALAWIDAIVAPEMIVLGGGLAEAGELLTRPLERALVRRLPSTRIPALSRARHGDAAAMIGAGYLARRRLGAGDP
ncbi:ROK family protein [Lysinimonas soli]|uniref:ROK family protein n=1 Tax=Lysinimonas soli TaxID=1074233 RepID=A0ABW0NJX6_9MICO